MSPTVPVIYAGAGNDVISGGAGDDEIYGGSGIDTIFGEAGDDFIEGGDGNDYIDSISATEDNLFESGADELYSEKLFLFRNKKKHQNTWRRFSQPENLRRMAA